MKTVNLTDNELNQKSTEDIVIVQCLGGDDVLTWTLKESIENILYDQTEDGTIESSVDLKKLSTVETITLWWTLNEGSANGNNTEFLTIHEGKIVNI